MKIDKVLQILAENGLTFSERAALIQAIETFTVTSDSSARYGALSTEILRQWRDELTSK